MRIIWAVNAVKQIVTISLSTQKDDNSLQRKCGMSLPMKSLDFLWVGTNETSGGVIGYYGSTPYQPNQF